MKHSESELCEPTGVAVCATLGGKKITLSTMDMAALISCRPGQNQQLNQNATFFMCSSQEASLVCLSYLYLYIFSMQNFTSKTPEISLFKED